VFELPGGWGLNPQLFFQLPNTLSNYVLGISYILYTYNLHHNFGRVLIDEKFNPQLIFLNSNTGYTKVLVKLDLTQYLVERRKRNYIFL